MRKISGSIIVLVLTGCSAAHYQATSRNTATGLTSSSQRDVTETLVSKSDIRHYETNNPYEGAFGAAYGGPVMTGLVVAPPSMAESAMEMMPYGIGSLVPPAQGPGYVMTGIEYEMTDPGARQAIRKMVEGERIQNQRISRFEQTQRVALKKNPPKADEKKAK